MIRRVAIEKSANDETPLSDISILIARWCGGLGSMVFGCCRFLRGMLVFHPFDFRFQVSVFFRQHVDAISEFAGIFLQLQYMRLQLLVLFSRLGILACG